MLARTHGKGQGISMSFRGMGKSLPMGTRSKDRQRPESRCRPYIGMSFRLAIPWPVALQQSQPPLRQLPASVNQGPVRVEKFSVNGTLSLNCLSHSRGQVQTLGVMTGGIKSEAVECPVLSSPFWLQVAKGKQNVPPLRRCT